MSHMLLETARSSHISALCTSVQVFNEAQTSRNSGAVSEAFIGVVYGGR